jgi:hypothetical protein
MDHRRSDARYLAARERGRSRRRITVPAEEEEPPIEQAERRRRACRRRSKACARRGPRAGPRGAGPVHRGGHRVRQRRGAELANAAAERGKIALDILYFHLDSGADPYFRLVDTADIPSLIVRAQKVIEDAETLIEELEAETAATEEPEEKKKRKRGKVDRETALLASGGVLTGLGIVVLGIGGLGLGLGYKHQLDAEHPAVYGEEYDAVAAKGQRANMMAYVGLPLGGALLATGIVLLVVAKRGKQKKPDEDKVTFSPTFGRDGSGIAISGRF